jgi:hypothetical protein
MPNDLNERAGKALAAQGYGYTCAIPNERERKQGYATPGPHRDAKTGILWCVARPAFAWMPEMGDSLTVSAVLLLTREVWLCCQNRRATILRDGAWPVRYFVDTGTSETDIPPAVAAELDALAMVDLGYRGALALLASDEPGVMRRVALTLVVALEAANGRTA